MTTLPVPSARRLAVERLPGPKLARVEELLAAASLAATTGLVSATHPTIDVLRRMHRNAWEPLGRFEVFDRVGLPPATGDAVLILIADALEFDLVRSSDAIVRVRRGSTSVHEAAV